MHVNLTISVPSLHPSYSDHGPPSNEPNAAVRGHRRWGPLSEFNLHTCWTGISRSLRYVLHHSLWSRWFTPTVHRHDGGAVSKIPLLSPNVRHLPRPTVSRMVAVVQLHASWPHVACISIICNVNYVAVYSLLILSRPPVCMPKTTSKLLVFCIVVNVCLRRTCSFLDTLFTPYQHTGEIGWLV